MWPNIQGQREEGKELEETALKLLTCRLVLPTSGTVFGSWHIFWKSLLAE